MASRKENSKATKKSAKGKKLKRTKSASKSAKRQLRKNDDTTARLDDENLQKIRAAVRADSGAAWLVDPKAATLSPLNAAGADAFHMENDAARSIMLDSAMPALKSLQKLASGKASDKSKKTLDQSLLFWTPDGARRHECRITRHRFGRRTVFVIQRVTAERTHSKNRPTPAKDTAKPKAAKSPPRDNAAILREIARRIRGGTEAAQQTIDDIPGELPEPQPDTNVSDLAAQIGSETDQGDPHQRAKLAHELRAPLAAIAAAAEVLKDEQFGSLDNYQYRDYARDIYQTAQHALKVIENGLSKSVGSSTDAAADTEPPQATAELNALVSNAVAMVKHLAASKTLKVEFEKSAREVWLACDATEVTQIVVNFLTNAVKFSQENGTITAAIFANLGEDVVVEIRDTGIGMSASDRATFQRAAKNKGPTPRAGGGYGLGLSLANALAEANGATIEIDSTPGRGTCARLVFPLRQMMAV